jgi:hypothetical protein
MQKLGDNRIGFTLINGVLISRTSFQTVSKKFFLNKNILKLQLIYKMIFLLLTIISDYL